MRGDDSRLWLAEINQGRINPVRAGADINPMINRSFPAPLIRIQFSLHIRRLLCHNLRSEIRTICEQGYVMATLDEALAIIRRGTEEILVEEELIEN